MNDVDTTSRAVLTREELESIDDLANGKSIDPAVRRSIITKIGPMVKHTPVESTYMLALSSTKSGTKRQPVL